MASLPNVFAGQPHVAAHNNERHEINQLQASVAALVADIEEKQTEIDALGVQVTTLDEVNRFPPPAGMVEPYRINPLSSDTATITVGATVDNVVYNQSYLLNSTTQQALNAAQTVDFLGGILAFSAGYTVSYGSRGGTVTRSVRFNMDGDRFAFYTGFAAGYGAMIYVDGRPLHASPLALTVGNQFNTVVFSSIRSRRIEIRTAAPLLALYTQAPYRLWKPPPARKPRVLVLGDSWVQGVGATQLTNAIYQNIAPELGVEDLWVDGIGGTGYGVHSTANGTDVPAGGGNRYVDRLGPNTLTGAVSTWDYANIQPDLIVAHGGGLNDKIKGRSNAQVIADAVAYFTAAREKCPDAKLVFVEGFRIPAYDFNADFVAIREGVQAALIDVGVYYVDVATSAVANNLNWIQGTGTVAAPSGTFNSNVYIAADAVHLTDAGNAYIRNRLADRLNRVLRDRGQLLNQLV